MKLKLTTLITVFVFIGAFLNKNKAQDAKTFNPYHIFDVDSLRGFDENAARQSAISEQFLGAEFKVRMYQLKRQYINDKFNLSPKVVQNNNHYVAKSAVTPACVNEDFEASTSSATLTASNQITGWTVGRGLHYPGPSGANSCNLLGYTNSPPVESAVFVVPNGYVDPVIGSVYPIYSVFGTSSGDANAESYNPQITQGMFGDNFIRINSDQLGPNAYSIEKLSKTFSVTASNALFQFAFISVFSAGHGCCDAGAFQLRLFNATTNSVITCPSFSASALSSACTNTQTGITYLNAITGTTASVNSANIIFNKWQVSSMDLSSYIGQNITIEVTASDCTGGGHYGYVYFDAQCGPMVVYGNGNPYAAGSGQVTVPTCGASGATLCAAAGLGPYYWAGPNIASNSSYATASFTNACFVTTLSATYTLYMNPPGACAPITRVINSTVTPAPGIFGSAIQALCGSTLAVVNVTPSGSSTSPAALTWAPPPQSLNSTTTSGTYVIPTTTAPLTVSITAADNVGCKATVTVNVLPAAPVPSFAISNASSSASITCANPVVNLVASSNYTYGTLNYFWASANATYSTNNVLIATAGNYTVVANDPVTNCSTTKTIAVGVFTTAPTSVISPSFQNITCSVTNVNATTLTATSPTLNISQQILSPLGGSLVSSGNVTSYVPNSVGIFTCVTTNMANGCSTYKTFTVSSNQGFPTFSVTSPQSFTLGCSTTSVATINIINASATNTNQVANGGPVSYTLIGPPTSSVTPPGTLSVLSSYTVNTPGTWTVVTKDNTSLCETRLPISVLANTQGPKLDSLFIPRNVLDCNTPTVMLTAMSLAPNISYNWAFPGPVGQLPTSTIVVSANFTVAATTTNIATYTLTLSDISTFGNRCVTTTVVPMYQNLFPPKANISSGSPELSCKTPSAVLTNISSSSIPPNSIFPTGNPVVGAAWFGPSPQISYSNTSTYLALTVGVYTMVAKDIGNGCTTTTVINIADNRIYPKINENGYTPSPLDCGSTVAIVPQVFPTVGVTYQWVAPEGLTIGTSTLPSLAVISSGVYKLTVTNTQNGCVSSADMGVVTSSMTTDFDADYITGYAPLTVNFTNNSRSFTGNNGINSVWNFGNGKDTVVKSTASTRTIYKLPGTYSVTLFANKGSCSGIVTKLIRVEIPSSMTIPNVFTPNGDGVNDIFFLKISNLAEIKATIYDRWGHKVYEIDTNNDKNNSGTKENVNLAWDGKNQQGKELPEGTYFYVIKATGKDGTDYDKKGTISLMK